MDRKAEKPKMVKGKRRRRKSAFFVQPWRDDTFILAAIFFRRRVASRGGRSHLERLLLLLPSFCVSACYGTACTGRPCKKQFGWNAENGSGRSDRLTLQVSNESVHLVVALANNA
jgi:hypothetical protein